MRMLDLLHPAPLSDREIHDARVVDVRTNEGYSPLQLPQFFPDGGVAIPGREPQRLCTIYQIKLQPSRGRARWHSVSYEIFRRAQSTLDGSLNN